MRMIVADIDGTLRDNKKDRLPAEMRDRAATLLAQGWELYFLTGAPAAQVPREVPFTSAFAECGGVKVNSQGLLDFDKALRTPIEILQRALGITPLYGLYGDAKARGIPVFLEGPRWTSITFLTGMPKHCPGFSSNVPIKVLKEMVREVIMREGLYLNLSQGEKPGEYAWLDVTAATKEATVATLQQNGEEIFYLGDGENDFKAMSRHGVTPVGFRNSVLEIRRLACQRGVYIDKPGPQGGALKFFDLLLEGRLG